MALSQKHFPGRGPIKTYSYYTFSRGYSTYRMRLAEMHRHVASLGSNQALINLLVKMILSTSCLTRVICNHNIVHKMYTQYTTVKKNT